jgi:hypothetical protein
MRQPFVVGERSSDVTEPTLRRRRALMVASGATIVAFVVAIVVIEQQPVDWVSAWIVDDAVRFVDPQRRLFVNDVQVPGEYVWVR